MSSFRTWSTGANQRTRRRGGVVRARMWGAAGVGPDHGGAGGALVFASTLPNRTARTAAGGPVVPGPPAGCGRAGRRVDSRWTGDHREPPSRSGRASGRGLRRVRRHRATTGVGCAPDPPAVLPMEYTRPSGRRAARRVAVTPGRSRLRPARRPKGRPIPENTQPGPAEQAATDSNRAVRQPRLSGSTRLRRLLDRYRLSEISRLLRHGVVHRPLIRTRTGPRRTRTGRTRRSRGAGPTDRRLSPVRRPRAPGRPVSC